MSTDNDGLPLSFFFLFIDKSKDYATRLNLPDVFGNALIIKGVLI